MTPIKKLSDLNRHQQMLLEGDRHSFDFAYERAHNCSPEEAYLLGVSDTVLPMPNLENTVGCCLPGKGITDRYRVQFPKDGVTVTIGYYPTLALAVAAAQAARTAFNYSDQLKAYEQDMRDLEEIKNQVIPSSTMTEIDFSTIRMVDNQWVDSNGEVIVVAA